MVSRDSVADQGGFDLTLMWNVIGPFKRQAIWVLVVLLFDTALACLGVGIIFPVFQSLLDPSHSSKIITAILPVVDDIKPESRLLIVALGTVFIFAMKAILDIYSKVKSIRFLQVIRFYWVKKIGEKYLFGPQNQISGKKQGELLNNWYNETTAASRFFQAYLSYLTSTALVIALVTIGMIISWKVMMTMLLAGLLLSTISGRYLFGRSAKLSRIKVQLNQDIQTSMVEDLAHIRELKLMAAENLRLNQLSQLCKKLEAAVIKGGVFSEIPRVAGEFFAVIGLMAFVVVGVVILKAAVSDILPIIAFFFIAFYRLVSAGSLAMSSRIKALNELHSVVVVHGLISHSDDREDMTSGQFLKSIETNIDIDCVDYSYDNVQKILSGVTTIIPKGKTSFLIGPSGSGKSSLLDLLMRFDEPLSGSIKINNNFSNEYSLSSWRKMFGYVSQDVALFNGDIKMNILLARPDASDIEIQNACCLAGADGFIDSLSEGLNTMVGDRGFSLSGGQRKRIAIARALIQNPSVLILDEATTSFEQSLERDMITRLRNALPNLTIIQVTHRLQTASEADWIIALENGVVVANGKWSDVQSRVVGLFQSSVLMENGKSE